MYQNSVNFIENNENVIERKICGYLQHTIFSSMALVPPKRNKLMKDANIDI